MEVVWYQCAFFLNLTFQLKWIMPFITDYLLSNTFELDMNNWIISCTFNDSGRIIFNSSSRKRAQIQGKVTLLQTEKPPLGFANLMAWWKGCQLLKMCFCLFEMLCPCHLISCDHDLFFHSLMETVTPRPNLKHIIMIRKIFSWKQNKQTKKSCNHTSWHLFCFDWGIISAELITYDSLSEIVNPNGLKNIKTKQNRTFVIGEIRY